MNTTGSVKKNYEALFYIGSRLVVAKLPVQGFVNPNPKRWCTPYFGVILN